MAHILSKVDDEDDSEMVVSRYFEPVTRRYRKSITIVRNIVAEDERRGPGLRQTNQLA